MGFAILYHPDIVSQDLSGMPANIKEIIKRAIEERLLKNPAIAGYPLRRSLKGYRKLRVGDYRVIHKIQNNLIIILKIGHRKDVYSKVYTRLNWQPVHNQSS